MNCFHSSFGLAEAEGMAYCEGWATGPNFATWLGRPHAWCLDASGEVVDSLYVDRAYDVWAYRGVIIPLDVARPHVARESAGTLAAYASDIAALRRATGLANR
jgi:hypothetical protein